MVTAGLKWPPLCSVKTCVRSAVPLSGGRIGPNGVRYRDGRRAYEVGAQTMMAKAIPRAKPQPMEKSEPYAATTFDVSGFAPACCAHRHAVRYQQR